MKAISKERTFTECVILDKESFDPDAVFMDDIVDDDVLPKLSLAVDGLTDAGGQKAGQLDLPAEQTMENEVAQPTNGIPTTSLSHTQALEVYGWESNLWRKIRGYLGF